MPRASTKKSARTTKKPASRTSTQVQNLNVEKTSSDRSAAKSFKVKKSYVILVVAIVVFAALLFYFRSLFVAAVVNGQPISRLSVVKESEKQSGKQALSTLVRNALIEQEANKEHIIVSEKEVDDEMKKVEDSLAKQGQKLDQVLATQGMSRNDLRKLVRLDKLVQKMAGKNIKVTDKEVADYIDKNKDTLPQNQTEAQLKASVKNSLTQQKLNTQVQSWLADLQNKAKIMYFVQY